MEQCGWLQNVVETTGPPELIEKWASSPTKVPKSTEPPFLSAEMVDTEEQVGLQFRKKLFHEPCEQVWLLHAVHENTVICETHSDHDTETFSGYSSNSFPICGSQNNPTSRNILLMATVRTSWLTEKPRYSTMRLSKWQPINLCRWWSICSMWPWICSRLLWMRTWETSVNELTCYCSQFWFDLFCVKFCYDLFLQLKNQNCQHFASSWNSCKKY